MIETLLGIIWERERTQCSRQLMEARTHLEAACLGVEQIWNEMANTWTSDPIIDRALTIPEWYVTVPASPEIYEDESDKFFDHLWICGLCVL